MTDIVEKLKDACNGHPDAVIPWPHRVLHEAADEIERLREAVMGLCVSNGKLSDENEGLVIEIGKLRELIVDFENNAVVGLRAVNILDDSNVAIRHGFQFLVGKKWIDVPVENVWEKADD